MPETRKKYKYKDYDRRYGKEYYRKNRDTLLARKRQRYADDPEYRQAIADSRNRQKERKIKELGDYVIREVNGIEYRVLKVGKVLSRLGISRNILITWESIGLLPKALYGFSRCYDDNQIELMETIMAELNKGHNLKAVKKKLAGRIKREWSRGL